MASLMSEENALPPVPAGHGFSEGDRIEMPAFDGKTVYKVRGHLKNIDVIFKKRRYMGLVLVGDDDGRYYEFRPEIAQRI